MDKLAGYGLVNLQLVAVFLGLEFSGHPLAGINAKLRPAQRLAILHPADVLAFCVLSLHPVILPIVGNRQDVIEQGVCLSFARAGVLVRERLILNQPQANGGLGRHSFVVAYGSQAFTVCDAP